MTKKKTSIRPWSFVIDSSLWFRLPCLLILLCAAVAQAEPTTGEQDLLFTARSPLSSAKTLIDRLGVKDATDDDDLAATHFLCYVPPDAATAGPMGLVVWLNYRAADVLPKSIEPTLDRTHTIFVVAKPASQAPWARAGLALDAAFNLKQRYTIDEHRVYLVSLLKADDSLGQQMGLAFADAFTGFAYVLNLRYFRPIVDGGTTYAGSFAKPLNASIFGQAKLRRHVLVGDFRMADTNRIVQKAYWQDGLTNTGLLETSVSAVTYPTLSADWFGKLLDTLTAIPATLPTTRIATSPAILEDEAARLLNLAKNLVAAHQPDSARAKLVDLINRFPDDPSIADAKALLDQLAKK